VGGPLLSAAPEVLFERREGVALVTLNRPDSLNALVIPMGAALRDAIREAGRDPAVGAIVVTGAGRAFSSGGDIELMKRVVDAGGRWEAFRPLVEAGREIALAIAACPRPVIAAVNGAAAGGGMGLALSCDVRWASERARFGQSFVRIGMHPDWGSLAALPRLIGSSRALELMWTGDLLDAAEALRLGIVSRVLAPEALLPEALEFASRLAHGPAVAIAEIKRSVLAARDMTLEQALARELGAQERCWSTRDAREGFTAFLEKRPPRFEGR
jgi:2-(1,2-epoxy-1,2-dihydrophenyl)acetyl-CoA isomerase